MSPINLSHYNMRNFVWTQNIFFMIKTCLLAFGSGVFFFFLILHSAWWVVPCVITWGAIFYWQDRQERRRQAAASLPSRETDKAKR
jgi:hypothetical protein